ncbi:hypothetical protein Ancab_040109 [Ancistrocladus abbreviatus]
MAYSSSVDETLPGEKEAFLQALNMSSSLLFAMSFRTVLELGLLEIIVKAGRGLSAVEIASQLSAKNPQAAEMLERMLRLLATYSVLNCTVVATDDGGDSRRLYELTSIGKFFVPNETGASLARPTLMFYYKPYLESWDKLPQAIMEGGIPFELAHGAGLFEFAGQDPTFNKEFNIGMTNFSTLVMKKVMELYKGFEDINQLVDVGGGLGDALKAITSQYPHIKGIKHIGGDMFQSVPSGEVILLKWVLHNWGDDCCIKLLKNCYKALPDNGRLIVIDIIIPEEHEMTSSAQYAFLSDVIMMAYNPAAKERTLKEFWSLANASGFKTVKLACRTDFSSVMEFYK